LILVPRQVMERVKNDSQLAAVLADGVAYALQRQGVRRITEEHVRLGEEAAGAALVAFAPGVAMVLAAEGASPGGECSFGTAAGAFCVGAAGQWRL
jgi:hypothetical protein